MKNLYLLRNDLRCTGLSLPNHYGKFNLSYLTKLESVYYRQARAYQSKAGVYGFNPKYQENVITDEGGRPSQFASTDGNLLRWIEAYRRYGHFSAKVNPLEPPKISVPELYPELYGLKFADKFTVDSLIYGADGAMDVSQIEEILSKMYCGSISAEFMHLPTIAERDWFSENFEMLSSQSLSKDVQLEIASDLIKSEIWDVFMGNKYSSVKRYGGEGAETLIPYCRETLSCLAADGVDDVVIGMAHRGRLNLLTGLLKVPPELLFRKMMGHSEFPDLDCITGDVLSHIVSSIDLVFGESSIHVSMYPNPSHLEAVNPVVAGKTRAKQRDNKEGPYSLGDTNVKPGDKTVCIQIHGDAAISGQGILQETLALSAVPHFEIGGTIHMVTNNQIGYTTPANRTRSGPYATDIAKFSGHPVIHVNGDDPESVVLAARLAVAYQRKFRRDVFVDVLCWRRWGHNELDNPRFTNPQMYTVIDKHSGVPDMYTKSLVAEGILTSEDKNIIGNDYNSFLSKKFKESDQYRPENIHLKSKWQSMDQAPDSVEDWETGVDLNVLKYVGSKSVQIPDGFDVHPNVQRAHINARMAALAEGKNIDWSTAEALAMGSLIKQGYNVRISGQDVGRGTFSQRHCMLVDQKTDEMYIPLNNLMEGQKGHLEVANSILSEEAVLGFEYGMSVENPNGLCIWEAQFGDFFNGAQIIIDTFISSGEAKWLRQSGLTMVLPHGYDGAGPEHSSCHYERFLQNCDSKEDMPDSERVNWNIAFPTTPAQYFHLLRRQMIRNYRKPLIVIGPKVLLRLPAAASPIEDLGPNTHFLSVIDDAHIDQNRVRKVIFVTGKHYYNLVKERTDKNIEDTAIIRIESLCPFPVSEINEVLSNYNNAESFVWAQEEHRNMGAWFFMNPRFRNLCGVELTYVGRDVLGTAAVGIGTVHKLEAKMVVEKPFLV